MRFAPAAATLAAALLAAAPAQAAPGMFDQLPAAARPAEAA